MEPNLKAEYSSEKISLLNNYVKTYVDEDAVIYHNLIKKPEEIYYMTFWMSKDGTQCLYKKFFHHYHNNKLFKIVEYNKNGDITSEINY
jgi:hypothetical protein